MKTLMLTIAAVMIATLALATGSVSAATSNGPYYATPAWDQQLDCFPSDIGSCPRFIVLSNWIDHAHPSGGAAVLDRETGLVWEQSPLAPCLIPVLCGGATDSGTRAWVDAQQHCNNLTVGGRKGWRLPAIQELASLVDPTVPFHPRLPPGHPFSDVQSFVYWSATSLAAGLRLEGNAWDVDFFGGDVGSDGKASPEFVWCVRGGQGVNPQ